MKRLFLMLSFAHSLSATLTTEVDNQEAQKTPATTLVTIQVSQENMELAQRALAGLIEQERKKIDRCSVVKKHKIKKKCCSCLSSCGIRACFEDASRKVESCFLNTVAFCILSCCTR
jgi:hypothetical protein